MAPIPASAIDRLSADALRSLHRAEGVRLSGLRPAVRAAVIVSGLAARLGLELEPGERHDVEHMPFVVQIEKGEVVIQVSPQADRRNGISQPLYHQWAAGVSASALVIDCHRMEHVNSVLIAWMLQVCQQAKPTPVHIARARPQVETQLKQLRLDHIMRIGKPA